MLMRKINKIVFVAGCLVLVAAASGKISVFNRIAKVKMTDAHSPLHQFDSAGICTCIPFTSKEELEQAPRLELNKSAEPFVIKYNKKNGLFLTKAKAATEQHFILVDSVLRMNEVPAELKYLAFIESGMKKNPVTRTGAIGPWALMPKAAQQYGLKTGRNDERLNYSKSTTAAAKLLKDMYAEYGDWLLAVAAYNCGPGLMQRAIKKSGSKDYWTLQHFLPEETRQHVKKFIAVHYHFEGNGSIVTMTKADLEKHINEVAVFNTKQKGDIRTDTSIITRTK
jgi:membrane-bound lytic murein transglycosylase D